MKEYPHATRTKGESEKTVIPSYMHTNSLPRGVTYCCQVNLPEPEGLLDLLQSGPKPKWGIIGRVPDTF